MRSASVERVVLAGRPAGNDASHTRAQHVVDDGGQDAEIEVATGVERRHDGDVDAVQREIHEPTVPSPRSAGSPTLGVAGWIERAQQTG